MNKRTALLIFLIGTIIVLPLVEFERLSREMHASNDLSKVFNSDESQEIKRRR